jgi:hypothetical protein
VHPGESVLQRVTSDDEWCAEAYMDTDYSKITREDYESVVRDYAIYRVMGTQQVGCEENDIVEASV